MLAVSRLGFPVRRKQPLQTRDRHRSRRTWARTLQFLAGLCVCAVRAVAADPSDPMDYIDARLAEHAGQSGVYILERGEEALLARAWLTDHARQSIDVQYFIWSTDNIGILASEALIRAADRGVRVRVIVDDLLIDAPDKSLLALAHHNNVEIRIYNPKVTVGTPLHRRLYNATTDFRGINQRMHNKTFIVDGRVAITGGRNMADEYFDFDHEYNFRDRDALLLGAVAAAMETSFEDYWNSHWSVPVAELYGGLGLMHKRVGIQEDEMQRVYQELHTYAASPENFAPAVHTAIAGMPTLFPQLAPQLVWGDVEFIADRPGKNSNRLSLGGGGLTTLALARLVESARTSIVIQSPYLVLSDAALALFRRARERGVRIRVSTNSLASTDNLQAFSGYRNQRARLLDLGLEIHEFRPDPLVQKQLMPVATGTSRHAPVFALHAKTLVVDSAVVVVGTYNLDPRSENLNTEVGVIVRNAALARQVEAAIERDMQAGNSWDAARDDPDRFASFAKRSKTRFWQLLPVKPLL